MRVTLWASVILLTATTAAQARPPLVVHANAVLRRLVPTTPVARWTNATGRTTTSLVAEGATLRGWSYDGSDPTAPTIIFFNASGMLLDDGDEMYRMIAKQGPPVVVFDYRGFGFSSGRADVSAMRRDAVRIVDSVVQSPGRASVVVYGFSQGSAMAGFAAARRPVAGLILAAPLASAREFIKSSRAPLLIVHGTSDADVPIAAGRDVFAASESPRKRFVAIDGATHAGAVTSPESLAAVRTFVASLKGAAQ
jgi:pimeloyl-ACP methyl ester carboxylesterase